MMVHARVFGEVAAMSDPSDAKPSCSEVGKAYMDTAPKPAIHQHFGGVERAPDEETPTASVYYS